MALIERATRVPILMNVDGSSVKLNRIPMMQGAYNEKWIQNLIENNPALLPTETISPEYSCPVCIGTEVPVGRGDSHGFIDALFVTPYGGIIVVETKLFRNQESRRAVVAQIIDYAKEVQYWTSADLNRIAASYSYSKFGQSMNLIDLMAKAGYLKFSDEALLNDSINRNLETASMLLLIVGDGIRTSLLDIAEFLNNNISMRSTIGLAELELYSIGDKHLIVPNLITRTRIVERVLASSHSDSKRLDDGAKRIQKPILTITEFISVFSENGGYDPDDIEEFISDVDSIEGVKISVSPCQLIVKCPGADGRLSSLMKFSITDGHADLYLVPCEILTDGEAKERYLDTFKQYLDVSRCRYEAYVNMNAHYNARVEDVLLHSSEMIAAVEGYASSSNE